jgi:NarL family two-component system response regulator LiaR
MSQIALLVDDERCLRAYASEVLCREGFEVVEAADGDDALRIVQSMHGTVNVLVTDIKMPHMTGIELVKAVRTDFPGIPVVYTSGEALRDGLHNPRARVAFVQKPFGPQALLDAVRTVTAPAAAASEAASRDAANNLAQEAASMRPSDCPEQWMRHERTSAGSAAIMDADTVRTHSLKSPISARTFRLSQISTIYGEAHGLTVEGFRAIVGRRYRIICTAADGLDLVDAALRLKPDVVVLAIALPRLNGIEAAHLIKTKLHKTKVLIVTRHDSPIYVQAAMGAGADGYVLKSDPPACVLEAIEKVVGGQVYISPQLSGECLSHLGQTSEVASKLRLTERERQILQQIAGGECGDRSRDLCGFPSKPYRFIAKISNGNWASEQLPTSQERR